MHEVRAVVVKAKNAPATFKTILFPGPGPGETLVDQYQLSRLDSDGFVTVRIGIEDLEPAFERMTAGKVLRPVVELDR
jgi:Zn-dependent alcohol dehydrogenase